jgi:HAD superfamily hydrolase (TIGR01509 family)
MEKGRIKVVIFDVQGVIVKVRSDMDYFRYLSGVSGKPPDFFMHPSFIDAWKTLEKGEISVKEFERRVSVMSGIPEQKIRWVDFYKEGLSRNKEVMDLIMALRRDYPYVRLATFSNGDEGRYPPTALIIDRELFDHSFVSYKLGIRKPDPEAYKMVLRNLNVNPEEAAFVDDRQENVEGARKAGIAHSILFTDVPLLQAALLAAGLSLRK